jgi:predicted methyltransferase
MGRAAWGLGFLAAAAVACLAPNASAPAPARPPVPAPARTLAGAPAAASTGGACPDRPPRPAFVRRRVPAPAMSHQAAAWLTRPERIQEEQPAKLIEALGLRPGMVVADIGAGVGYHTWLIAPRVLPGGRVLATDVQPEMLDMLRESVRQRGFDNVTAVPSTHEASGLPAGSVDLALMVDVYHEFGEPERYLADVRRALRPGGRLALVEFRAEDPNVPIRREHKMSADEATAELEAADLCLAGRTDSLPWQHLLFYEPAGPCGCPRPRAPGP